MTRIGSLFSGSGMLDEGVRAVLGGTVAWHAEIEPAAVRVLDHRYPGVPNLGDVSTVDWTTVEPVDVLTGGFPCQDVSLAGARRGLRDGTRSGLWVHYARAIEVLRPRLVVIENVRGLLSAHADGSLEPCPLCVGDGQHSPLRALGAVLGDLASLGFDADWHGLRAADVGAPHGRFRVFVVAYPRHRDDTERPRSPRRLDGERSPVGAVPRCDGDVVADAICGGRPGWASESRRGALRRVATEGATDVAAPDADGGRREQPDARLGDVRVAGASGVRAWGRFEQAIAQWEAVTGQAAPSPTHRLREKNVLNPQAVEFIMGWPVGWVTDVPGISRNEALKLCGNGVVPQQAAAALARLLASAQSAAVA